MSGFFFFLFLSRAICPTFMVRLSLKNYEPKVHYINHIGKGIFPFGKTHAHCHTNTAEPAYSYNVYSRFSAMVELN